MYLGGYIRKVSVKLVPKYFSHVRSTNSFSCSKRKNWKKTRLKQVSKTKEGKSKLCYRRRSTWLIITLLSHRYRSAIAPLSLCFRSAVAPLLHRYRSAVAPPLSLRCRTTVAPLSHRYLSTVAPLLSLLMSLRCRTAIALVLLHCCSDAVALLLHRCRAVVEPLLLLPREGINNSILNCCCYTVTPL